MSDCQDSLAPMSRLGNCEVCNSNQAKYTCPECEVKTCSLPCVKIHKKELECSGIRNKVKFKTLKKFTNMDFQSDYMLLENTTRATDTFKKVGKGLQNSNFYSIPRMKIKNAAHKRNIHLYYLPKTFTRHKSNTTYYDWKKDKIFWKVEWVFPEAEMISLVDNRVSETETLSVTLHKYFDSEQCEGERSSPPKFYIMDKDETLMENLSSKRIIENPVFYVIFSDSLSKYAVDRTESTVKDKYSNNYKGINLLFSTAVPENDR